MTNECQTTDDFWQLLTTLDNSCQVFNSHAFLLCVKLHCCNFSTKHTNRIVSLCEFCRNCITISGNVEEHFYQWIVIICFFKFPQVIKIFPQNSQLSSERYWHYGIPGRSRSVAYWGGAMACSRSVAYWGGAAPLRTHCPTAIWVFFELCQESDTVQVTRSTVLTTPNVQSNHRIQVFWKKTFFPFFEGQKWGFKHFLGPKKSFGGSITCS